FFTTYVPKLWDLGITVPDPALRWDEERGEWAWGAEDWVDWDEFWQVVRGNGPMTSVRLLYCKAMWDTHAWVREVFAGISAAPVQPGGAGRGRRLGGVTPVADESRLALLLALADDELVLGHRHAEWTGWAPHIEEDLAFSSIAQDEMAHARLLYELAGGLTGRDVDALALGRSANEYRNAVLCERPNGDWGFTIARQYLYDTAD